MVEGAQENKAEDARHYHRALVTKAYALLSTDRDDEAFDAISAALATLEASGGDGHFFNTVSESGDAFKTHASAEMTAEIYQRGMTSPLFASTTSPGRAPSLCSTMPSSCVIRGRMMRRCGCICPQ
ncbi:hypothetical protein [Pannonibacter indicus]|uniref:hypothetical protein n=1 Tax=Pannonibacter indicus TaxID=466044 RepID=UPI00391CDAA5